MTTKSVLHSKQTRNSMQCHCSLTDSDCCLLLVMSNKFLHKLTKEYFGRQGSPHSCTAADDGPPEVLLELYDKRTFVPNERFAQDFRNLLLPHWGGGNRGVWAKGEYGNGPLGADQFSKLGTRSSLPLGIHAYTIPVCAGIWPRLRLCCGSKSSALRP